MAGRQHFPLSESRRWPGQLISQLEEYFSNTYCAQTKRACCWDAALGVGAKVVGQAADGLARSRDRIRAPKPAVTRSLFMEISGRNALSDVFVQSVWVSWAFLLRFQSERAPFARRLAHGKIDEDSALEGPAVMGPWNGHVVIKLHRRKHMAGGPRMARKCICDKCPNGSPGTHVFAAVLSGAFLLGKRPPARARGRAFIPGAYCAKFHR